MLNPKQCAIELLASLPEESSYDEIHYLLYVCEKVQRGRDAIENGEYVSHDEAKRRMNSKRTTMEAIAALPENCTIEELQRRLIFCSRIQQGEREIAEGNTFTQDQAKERLQKWLASSGQLQP